jgi:hypothetical protein
MDMIYLPRSMNREGLDANMKDVFGVYNDSVSM